MMAKAASEMTSSVTPAPSQVQRTWASILSDPATADCRAPAVNSPTTAIATAAETTARAHPGLPGRLARLSITGAVPPRSASVEVARQVPTINALLSIPEMPPAQARRRAPRGLRRAAEARLRLVLLARRAPGIRFGDWPVRRAAGR